MTDRERFEEWALANNICHGDIEHSKAFPEQYRYLDVQYAWEAWQAAIGGERNRLKEVLIAKRQIAKDTLYEPKRERRINCIDWAIQQIEEAGQ